MAKLTLERTLYGEELAGFITEQEPVPAVVVSDHQDEYKPTSKKSKKSATHYSTSLNYDNVRILRNQTTLLSDQIRESGLDVVVVGFNQFNFTDNQGIYGVLLSGFEIYPHLYDKVEGELTLKTGPSLPHVKEVPRFIVSASIKNIGDPKFGEFIGIFCRNGYI